MILYHNDAAVCAQKVRLALAEKNIAYESRLLDLRAGESHTADYLKLNSKGVVPTLIDTGQVITESTIINEYLEQKFPDVSLHCKSALDNSRMRSWVMRTDTGLLQACGGVSFSIAFRHQEQSRQLDSKSAEERKVWEDRNRLGLDYPASKLALKYYYQLIVDMSKRLDSNQWLAGDAFSLAECALIPYVRRLADLALSWIWEEDETKQGLNDWYRRCCERPSFKIAIEQYASEEKKILMYEKGIEARSKVESILQQI